MLFRVGQIGGGFIELRCPREMARQRRWGRHLVLSLLQLLADGQNPATPAHPGERTWEM